MDEQSLSHTKWKCQYHIVIVPKYRRKVIYGKLRKDIGVILRKLCEYKHVEIIESACDAGSYPHAAVDPTEAERRRLHGILKREKSLCPILKLESN